MKRFDSFLVLDIFDAQKGTQNNMNALIPGTLPLVSAKKIDNGYRDFVEKDCGKIFRGHCLTLNNDGDGGAGLVFYQPSDFALDTHVTALYPKRKMTRLQMLYIANCISKQRSLFGHGRSINSSRLAHLTCMLPVNEAGEPDYEFMEEYMKTIEKKLLKRYQEYLNKKTQTQLIDNNIDNGGIKWKDYDIKTIFPDIKRGKRLKNEDHISGDMPYVSSSGLNNGVDDFVNNKEGVRIFEDCLSLANSGSVGSTFYHPYKYVASDHVTKLKNKEYNKYIYLYLATITSRLSEKYSYNREINEGRLNREKMIVPINKSGLPDYKYMENYMRAKEIEIINRYITKRLSNL